MVTLGNLLATAALIVLIMILVVIMCFVLVVIFMTAWAFMKPNISWLIDAYLDWYYKRTE